MGWLERIIRDTAEHWHEDYTPQRIKGIAACYSYWKSEYG
jgi:hypothetical protein